MPNAIVPIIIENETEYIIENQKKSLNAFSGSSLESILPENLKPGPENIINSNILGPMRDGLNLSIENIRFF